LNDTGDGSSKLIFDCLHQNWLYKLRNCGGKAFCFGSLSSRTRFTLFPNKKQNMNDALGYTSSVFLGKAEQMVKVASYVNDKGFVPRELVDNEVSWFYGYEE
jgi:hypothetical protein